MDIEQIEKRVKETLSERRYNHSIEVMKRCRELAEIYGEDVHKAELVGLAHDVAKEMKIDEIMKIVKEKDWYIIKLLNQTLALKMLVEII